MSNFQAILDGQIDYAQLRSRLEQVSRVKVPIGFLLGNYGHYKSNGVSNLYSIALNTGARPYLCKDLTAFMTQLQQRKYNSILDPYFRSLDKPNIHKSLLTAARADQSSLQSSVPNAFALGPLAVMQTDSKSPRENPVAKGYWIIGETHRNPIHPELTAYNYSLWMGIMEYEGDLHNPNILTSEALVSVNRNNIQKHLIRPIGLLTPMTVQIAANVKYR